MMNRIICELTCMEVAPLSDEGLFREWLERMPESRKRKIASLRNAESQRLSLGVGILLFQALEARGLDGSGAEIAETEFGKPYLVQEPGIHFSLSHAGDRALCAVCNVPVGCDIERIGRGDRRIVRRFFHEREQRFLEEADDPEKWQRCFAEIWTRKESRVKADGRGLSLPLTGFQTVDPEPGTWYDECAAAEGYLSSCCVLSDSAPVFSWRKTEVG